MHRIAVRAGLIQSQHATKTLVKFVRVVFELCGRTDRQTDILSQYFSPLSETTTRTVVWTCSPTPAAVAAAHFNWRITVRPYQQHHTCRITCNRDLYRNCVTLTVDLLPWTTSVPTFTLTAQDVCVSERGHWDTQKQTDRQTDEVATDHLTHASVADIIIAV